MTGAVDANLEARLALRLRGPNGEREIEAVIDTGFTDYLLLPPALLASLGLPAEEEARAILGDGSTVLFDVHSVEALWHGDWRMVRAFAGGDEPLIGVSLLVGSDLHIRFHPEGEVSVDAA